MAKSREKQKRAVKILLWPLLFAAAYALLVSAGAGYACPIYALTGWYCPMCGASRMAARLLTLDFPGAFRAHAVLMLTLPFLIWIYAKGAKAYIASGRFRLEKREHEIFKICVIVLILTGILRNITAFSFLQPH